MKIRKILSVLILIIAISFRTIAQDHPHILVNDNDKSQVLNKISQRYNLQPATLSHRSFSEGGL